jgi:hypothetical protein
LASPSGAVDVTTFAVAVGELLPNGRFSTFASVKKGDDSGAGSVPVLGFSVGVLEEAASGVSDLGGSALGLVISNGSGQSLVGGVLSVTEGGDGGTETDFCSSG